MSIFTEYVHVLQDDIIFPRLKEKKIDIDGDIYDIVWEEIDDYINKTYNGECEELLFSYGFAMVMADYNSEYGIDSLKDISPYTRVKCLLHCAVHNYINENIVENYKEWFNENMDKDEDEEDSY
jgi:hypothetical protein